MHQVFETQFDTRWDALLLRLDFNLSQMLRVLLLSVMHSLWRCISSHSFSFLHRCSSSAAGSCLRSLQSYSRLSFFLSLATLLEIISNLSCISASYNFTRWSCSVFFRWILCFFSTAALSCFFFAFRQHLATSSATAAESERRLDDVRKAEEKEQRKERKYLHDCISIHHEIDPEWKIIYFSSHSTVTTFDVDF